MPAAECRFPGGGQTGFEKYLADGATITGARRNRCGRRRSPGPRGRQKEEKNRTPRDGQSRLEKARQTGRTYARRGFRAARGRSQRPQNGTSTAGKNAVAKMPEKLRRADLVFDRHSASPFIVRSSRLYGKAARARRADRVFVFSGSPDDPPCLSAAVVPLGTRLLFRSTYNYIYPPAFYNAKTQKVKHYHFH